MYYFIFGTHVVICFAIIGLVLLQQGKGAEAGAVFGSNSETVLGPGAGPSFITKLTTGLAIGFMLTTILLVKTYIGGGVVKGNQVNDLKNSVVNRVAQQPVENVAAPVAAASPVAVTETAKVVEVPAPAVEVVPPVAPVAENK